MKLLFTAEALNSYNEIKTASQREADQIKDVLKDILAHPKTGKGVPQALTGALAGLWSREAANRGKGDTPKVGIFW